MAADRPIPKEFEGLLELEEIRALQNEFLDETAEELERVLNAIAAADAGQFEEDSIHQLFRAVHSLKGSASVFGYDDLSRLSHKVEAALAPIRALPIDKIAARIDDMLSLVALLLGLVRDGKFGRMDCESAEIRLADWESGRSSTRNSASKASTEALLQNGSQAQSGRQDLWASQGRESTALIADSAQALHHMLHRFLEPYQIGWVDCQSGAEVIERCAVETPTFLFLGYLLADMNTAELLTILHEAGIAPAAIVIISSRSEEELRQVCPYPFTFIRKDHTLLSTRLPLVQSLAEE